METTEPPAPRIDAQAAIRQLSTILLGRESLDGVMDTVVRLARDSIPGTDEASLTLVRDDTPQTAAFTGTSARDLDERQYEAGYGPCLDAAASGETIGVTDDSDYPEFMHAAHRVGVRSTLSVPLPVPQATVGALNLYSFTSAGFPGEQREAAATFAAAAAIAVANVALYEETATLAEQMREALVTRAVIDQAKGILMRDNRCTAEEAFRMLVSASNRSNRKLRDLAQSLVDGTARGA